VVNAAAARDSEASHDPSIAELISFRHQSGSPARVCHATKETTMATRNSPAPDHQHPDGLPAPGMAAMASPAPGSAYLIHRRQLEKSLSWSGRERLRCLWYRLRLTVAEMNYATRRTVELQAPWISDDHTSH
jgi:hypothetical protein